MNDYKEQLFNIINIDNYTNYESPNIIPIIKYASLNNNYKLYLCGDLGSLLVTLRWLKNEGINPNYIVSDENIKKENYLHIDNLHGDFTQSIVLLTSKEEHKHDYFLEKLQKLKIDNLVDIYKLPKVPLLNEEYFTYFKDNSKIYNIIDLLEDDYSKKVLVEYLRSKFMVDFYRYQQMSSVDKYFDSQLFNLSNHENVLNMGSSNGDTLFYYLNSGNVFNTWYANEIDQKRVLEFKRNIKILPLDIQKRIYVINQKLNAEILKELLNISLITMDVEGDELESLYLMQKILKSSLPILSISAYHKPDDLVKLPLFIKSISDDYTLFFRKYASTYRNKFRNAELVLYGVPRKRLKK